MKGGREHHVAEQSPPAARFSQTNMGYVPRAPAVRDG